MPRDRRGISTIECLIAITVFSLGALGSAGTVALGIRLSTRGTHAAEAARLAAESLERLRSSLANSSRSCAALTPGSLSGAPGQTARWTIRPAAGGAEISILTSYPTPTGQHVDSASGFLRCH